MKFLFQSVPTNLGRFGDVKKGDILELTQNEAQSIKGDKRFKAVTDEELKKHKPGHFVSILATMTNDEKRAAEAANKAEKQRLESLEQANDSRRVYVQEVREMTYEQLEELAKQINDRAGRKVVDYHPKQTSRPDLATRILALDERARGVVEEEESEAPTAAVAQ